MSRSGRSTMERSFFHQVLDAFEGFVSDVDGDRHSFAHRRGLKVWYGDATREHYEAQLIRSDAGSMLEVGFHVEYSEPGRNDEVLAALVLHESSWRGVLGDDPEYGEFLGSDRWRRISEVWDPPDADDLDASIEVAARLADYVIALEPIRRTR